MRFKTIFTVLFVLSAICSVNGQTTLSERLEQHVNTLASDSLQGRRAGSKHARMAADYIIEQLREIRIDDDRDSVILQTFSIKNETYQNIIFVIRGNDSVLKNEFIVVGAHYDHLGVNNGEIHNGADDNASGVAVLIELARKLLHEQANLKRTVVLVAFDAEEIGLHGSTFFIEQFARYSDKPIDDIKLMMSIDMVGWYGASGEVQYIGSGTLKGGKKLILSPEFIPKELNVRPITFETSSFRGTDTQPFARKGIPTFAVTTGLKSPYHKPGDEAHLIDFDGMVLITEHLKNLVIAVSQNIDYESSGRVARIHQKQPRFMIGASGNFGVNRHYYTAGPVNGKQTISFGGGLMSQVNFGTFAIRPEVHGDMIYAKYPGPAGRKMIITENLTIPLSLVVQHLQYGQGVDFFIGGYYAYRFDGRYSRNKSIFDLFPKEIDFENDFNREEFGLTWGFGFYVRPFKIGFTNRRALTNFSKIANADNAHIRNRTNYFTIGLMF
jgi:hypothetical protein